MILMGKVFKGAIVLPPDAHLPEGAEVEVRTLEAKPRAKTGRELAKRAWTRRPRLSSAEAESFARDVETARSHLPPLKPLDWP